MKWLLNKLINNINVLAHIFWRYSTVDLDCDLEKISRKLKFGIDVPYTFRIHQKKSPPIAPWEQPKSIMADL